MLAPPQADDPQHKSIKIRLHFKLARGQFAGYYQDTVPQSSNPNLHANHARVLALQTPSANTSIGLCQNAVVFEWYTACYAEV